MRYCIPDELFNRIPYPVDGLEEVGIDGIYSTVAYKLPGAEEVVVRREIWHTLCDFCVRTGALLRKMTGSQSVEIVVQYGKFIRIVGAEKDGVQTTAFTLSANPSGGLVATFPDGTQNCAIYASIRPLFDDVTADASGDWTPRVPQYLIDRYGECIAHGALARLFAMRGEGEVARMHATAYNNDLNRLSFGLITSGMRKHLLIDVEDWLVNTNGNR